MSEENKFPLETDSYQTTKTVAVTVYKHGKDVKIIETGISEQGLVIKCLIDGKEYDKAWAFFGEIDQQSMKVDDGSKKIEIEFKKLKQGNWPRAENGQEETKPLYQKWKEVHLPQEEEDKNEGIDKFLQGIYANASDEAKRAMNKSFVESGGTVLSTNWEDVGKRKVEPQPPK